MKAFPKYDIVVCGGGVAGVAAAVAAKRAGKSVLLLEKTTLLGGLATIGIINYFMPLCNGRGKQAVKGMAEEFLRLSVSHGFDTLPPEWKDGEPLKPTKRHYTTDFSAQIFALDLIDLIVKEGVDIRYDAMVTDARVRNGRIESIEIVDKSGRRNIEAKIFIDATGDADLCMHAGMNLGIGMNYFSYFGRQVTLESCAKAVAAQDIGKIYQPCSGGAASLSGDGQPQGRRLYAGGDPDDISEYLVENQLALINKLKTQDRKSREVVTLPTMPQMRATRHFVGDHTFTKEDKFLNFDDSVGVVSDFCTPTDLYEVRYGTLIKSNYPNLLVAGRCASAEGWGWDVLRVIPPCILTGQAAGTAAAQAVDRDTNVQSIDIPKLQQDLAQTGVIIHITKELTEEVEITETLEELDKSNSHLVVE